MSAGTRFLRYRFFAVILTAAVSACAVIEPPSGGPEDKDPPSAVAFEPRPDSAGVSRSAALRIDFNEKVDSESFKNRVRLYPPVEFDKVKVKGTTLEIHFKELLPETTICVLLEQGFKDVHGVRSDRSTQFCFATTDSIDSGRISGRILFKGEPDSTGIVKAFKIGVDTLVNMIAERESRITPAAGDGGFQFNALPTDSAGFLLWGFRDTNGDGKFTSGKDLSLLLPDTLVLTPERRAIEGLLINVIDPNEPGSVTGRVINESGIDKLPIVRFDPILPGERPLLAVADTVGQFKISTIRPGGYLFSTFIDMEADTLCGSYTDPGDSTVTLPEPCYIGPDTLVIKPGEDRMLEPVFLRKEGER